jgi:hypothetical protein
MHRSFLYKLKMSNYIATYFYHDVDDVGASYGNIFLPLKLRNLVYWKTVYTLFFTSIVKNKFEDIKYVLFTNVSVFPLRAEIELLGVIVFDDLKLNHRNSGKWAAVKFFFDVIDYVEDSLYFKVGDGIVMLDTDCIALNNAVELFSYVEKMDRPLAYITARIYSENFEFHGLSISKLEDIFDKIFLHRIKIISTMGGEFFAFRKDENLEKFRAQYEQLLNSPHGHLLTTEEQILTMCNADMSFMDFEFSVYRIWTSYRNHDVPKNLSRFIFLHLPSEKTYGLSRLFKHLIEMVPSSLTSDELNKIIYKCVPINSFIRLYFRKILDDLINKIYKLINKI